MRNLYKKVLAALILVIAVAFAVSYIMVLLQNLQLRQENGDLKSRNEQLSTLQDEVDTLRQEQNGMQDQMALLESEKTALESEKEELSEQIKAHEASALEAEKNLRKSTAASMKAGDVLPEPVAEENLDDYFTISEIRKDDAVYTRIAGKSFPADEENAQIKLEDLRYLKMLHVNFEDQTQVGEMIVNASIAEDTLEIFRQLYLGKYQIERMVLIDEYWAGNPTETDSKSIDANNTSCFNYRTTAGSGELSPHGYGLAIDINPIQNPFISSDGRIYHADSDPYRNRETDDPHVIHASEDDLCYSLFTSHGFKWGGDQSAPIDYQHFEK